MKNVVAILVCVSFVLSMTLVSCQKVDTNVVDDGMGEIIKAYELGFLDGKEEGGFDAEENVSVIDAITVASLLHANYNNTEIKDRDLNNTEVRFDFDDDSIVDTSGGRNARQQVGIVFGRCDGEFNDGILTVKDCTPNSGGAFDPQIMFNKFNVDSRDFDTVTIRMRVVERLPEVLENVPVKNNLQFYFATSDSPGYDNKKIARANFDLETENEWFDIVLDMSQNEFWKDTITNFRFDPPENNGVYQLDYLVLSKNQTNATANWYDKYIDYAIKNDIIDEKQYYEKDYGNLITRAEMCELVASAIPEEYFASINDIKGIPDVDMNSRNAEVYLMLYKAGILLGDTEGNFNAKSEIKHSELAYIVNRVLVPENRLQGNVNANWYEESNKNDVEFNDEACLENLKIQSNGFEIKDGALVLKALDKGEGQPARFDTKIINDKVSIIAKKHVKLRIRFKADIVTDSGNTLFDFYYATSEEPNYAEDKAVHADLISSSYKDAAGWYILEIDLATMLNWKSRIVSYRFDPTNADGTFVIDYIRFVKADPLLDASHEKLVELGYTAQTLFEDPDYERGFYVAYSDNGAGKPAKDHGRFTDYCETDEEPAWNVCPFFTRLDLATERDMTTDKYTLTDKEGISTVIYNPEIKSITLRLNGAQNYLGKPHIDGEYSWWPHLLLNQNIPDLTPEQRKKNGADADRIFMDIDVRVLDFKKNPVMEGHHSLTFPIFFYLYCDDAPNAKIWFSGGGIIHNNPKNTLLPAWTTDSAAHQYIYGTTMVDLYNGLENSYNIAQGVYLSGEEWKHLRIDLTPHLERCIEWANRDNAFGVKVSKDNLYFGGANIGFEIFGNYDATVEFKNFDMTFYRKGE